MSLLVLIIALLFANKHRQTSSAMTEAASYESRFWVVDAFTSDADSSLKGYLSILLMSR